MDFRRTTEDNPEENCECYNKAYLRAMAHKENLPVIHVDAEHGGIPQEEGLKFDESRFNGLAAELELCEGARVIIIHNLAVEFGLMNGTQGVVKQIGSVRVSHEHVTRGSVFILSDGFHNVGISRGEKGSPYLSTPLQGSNHLPISQCARCSWNLK